MSIGDAQFFSFAWSVDYPDPENFLFLFYGANSKVNNEGVNSTNYKNPAYDQLFDKLRYLDNGPEKEALIQQMLTIIRKDAPWVFGFHPEYYVLAHAWNAPVKLSEVANNTYKYASIDPIQRAQLRKQWNIPIIWPIFAVIGLLLIIWLPVFISYWRKEHQDRRKRI